MAKKKKWKFEDIPDQTGKISIVTGANSGLGFEEAKALTRKGAPVVMACRNLEKAEEAKDNILSEFPEVSLEIMHLDLSDLSSIRKFVKDFKSKHESLNILCNNAGIMMIPYQKTVDGFELQLGTNHFGHFALTGLLIETLIKTENSRIVTMSSFGHKMGKMDFEDLNWEKSYGRTKAYSRSKLANLLFAYELQRRLEAKGESTISIASNPGWTRTNLQRNVLIFRIFNPFMSMKPPKGALSMLYAATAPEAEGGAHITGQVVVQVLKVILKKSNQVKNHII
jgi:NAD(P)-dependent dehydrogenase (short-subunit alcohol dehydrogenase family)